MSQLRLHTLGQPRVFNGGEELADLPAQRLRFALLVFLAVEGRATREAVLSMFWADREASRARHALRQMLYELRQLLGEAWVEQGRDWIEVRASVDATEFERAATEGRVDDALALYAGDFLLGFSLDNHGFDGWLERYRAHLGRRHRRLRRDQITELVAAGRTDAAIRAAQTWVELDPLEDEANHALIHALALGGQRQAALQAYDSYERQLAAELQLTPLDSTQALVASIRAGDVVAAHDSAVSASPAASGSPAGAASATSSAGPTSQPPATPSAGPASPSATPAAATTPPDRRAPQPPQLPQPQLTGTRGRLWRRLVPAAAALVVLVSIAIAMRVESPPPLMATPPAVPRVAILPFEARDSTLRPLATLLSETLVRSLNQSRPLQIVSPEGLGLLRRDGVPLDSIQRMRDIDYFVSASVGATTGGDSVVVTLDVLDGRTGAVIGSAPLKRAVEDGRLLLDDVVLGAAGRLRMVVGYDLDVRRARSRTSNDEAWKLTLEARALGERVMDMLHYRDYASIHQVLDQADSLLVRAAELDRRWAEPVLARGSLWQSRSFVAMFALDSAAERKALEASRGLATLALERDPVDHRAWELRGEVHRKLGQKKQLPPDTARALVARAEKDLRRAAELAPERPSPWRSLADLLYQTGRYAAARHAALRAWEIDPYEVHGAATVFVLFNANWELHEDEEARRWCEEGRRRYPAMPPFVACIFQVHAWASDVKPQPALLHEELAKLRASRTLLNPSAVSLMEAHLAAAYARAGQPDSARAILARHGSAMPALNQALVQQALGEHTAALQMLDSVVRSGSPDVARRRPFTAYRGDPVYERLVSGG